MYDVYLYYHYLYTLLRYGIYVDNLVEAGENLRVIFVSVTMQYMKVLITGAPGSGKSSLAKYDISQGSTYFFDSDEVEDLCEWRDFKTGQIIGSVQSMEDKESDKWHRRYGWYWNQGNLRNFLTLHEPIVLCGSAENVVESFLYFERIVILKRPRKNCFLISTVHKEKIRLGKLQNSGGF
jgi:hypothetical protein